jgi:outer membrane receptor protein involved in Fe transport
VSLYAQKLLGRDWSVGARYRVSEAQLAAQLPGLAGVPGVAALDQNTHAWLQHVQLSLRFNHPSGFFGGWSSDWYLQSNYGYAPALPGDAFWQHQVFLGYVTPHRHAELRLEVMNLANQDYRLNPLNLQPELARRRTLFSSLRFNF